MALQYAQMEDGTSPALSFNPSTAADGAEPTSERAPATTTRGGEAGGGIKKRGSASEFGLLLATTKIREGATMEEVTSEVDRDDDLVLIEQDNQLRMRQSVASTLNDPTMGDEEDWWGYLESWSDWASTDTPDLAIPMVTPPDVQASHFDAYLSRMSSSRAFLAENALELMRLQKEEEEEQDAERDVAAGVRTRVASTTANPDELRRVLTRVPSEYMKNPSAFYVEDTPVIEAAFSEEGEALLHELQEYEEVVEEQLLLQISCKFHSFSSLLVDLDGLREQIGDAVECLATIRGSIHSIDEPVKQGLQVSELMARRRETQLVHERLRLVSDLQQSQATMKSLLTSNDFTGAHRLAAESTLILNHDLKGCRALHSMLHKVNKMSLVVHNKMQADFVECATTFTHEEASRETLLALLHGLAHAEQLVSAFGRYRAALQSEVKRGVERCIQELVATSKLELEAPRESKNDALNDLLGGLTHSSFLALLTQVAQAQMSVLRRAADLHTFVCEALGPEVAAQSSVSVLYDACDECHKRAARLLNARGKQSNNLTLAEFHQMFELVLGFAVDTEKLLGLGEAGHVWWEHEDGGVKAQPVALRGSLLTSAKSFVDVFHTTRLQKLNALLEQEQWSQAEVPPEFQRIADTFAQRQDSMPPEQPAPAQQASTRVLTVQGQQYRVPMSLLILMKILCEYMHCADQLPALCTDILTRAVEILSQYNSRTCQLVLGAGAMHVAGLKSITARHLVLASQCLSVMLLFIPLVRTYLAGYMPARHEVLLVGFDKVAKDYLEHRSSIHTKIVHIFKERIDFHCKAVVATATTDEAHRQGSGQEI